MEIFESPDHRSGEEKQKKEATYEEIHSYLPYRALVRKTDV